MNLSASPLHESVELKARLRDREAALATARRLGAADLGEDEQTDTYFTLGIERLKLRESSSGAHALIRTSRQDRPDVRKCQFRRMAVKDPGSFKSILSRQWGAKAVVRKVRHAFLWQERVRIHFDRVDGIGDFVEFEAALDTARPDYDAAAAALDVARLAHDFGVAPEDHVAASYANLVLEASDVPTST